MSDPTNPKYYSTFPIQPYDFLWANREYIGYTEGNIIKYVCRYSGKNGLEDLKKAQWYLNELVRRTEAAQSRVGGMEEFEPDPHYQGILLACSGTDCCENCGDPTYCCAL